jgi:hypothetical protein
VVEVPKWVELPAECRQPILLTLPPRASAEDVMAAQSAALARYRVLIESCAALGGKPVPY